jgi:hypothetical protein
LYICSDHSREAIRPITSGFCDVIPVADGEAIGGGKFAEVLKAAVISSACGVPALAAGSDCLPEFPAASESGSRCCRARSESRAALERSRTDKTGAVVRSGGGEGATCDCAWCQPNQPLKAFFSAWGVVPPVASEYHPEPFAVGGFSVVSARFHVADDFPVGFNRAWVLRVLQFPVCCSPPVLRLRCVTDFRNDCSAEGCKIGHLEHGGRAAGVGQCASGKSGCKLRCVTLAENVQ